ncbi:hypothetical protein C8J57DRAFT_1258276 [Mycena rebaudengoi]|nr:hypothetical protein C8J57DRAFT_1258276 [Mycena rebaudengoi]
MFNPDNSMQDEHDSQLLAIFHTILISIQPQFIRYVQGKKWMLVTLNPTEYLCHITGRDLMHPDIVLPYPRPGSQASGLCSSSERLTPSGQPGLCAPFESQRELDPVGSHQNLEDTLRVINLLTNFPAALGLTLTLTPMPCFLPTVPLGLPFRGTLNHEQLLRKDITAEQFHHSEGCWNLSAGRLHMEELIAYSQMYPGQFLARDDWPCTYIDVPIKPGACLVKSQISLIVGGFLNGSPFMLGPLDPHRTAAYILFRRKPLLIRSWGSLMTAVLHADYLEHALVSIPEAEWLMFLSGLRAMDPHWIEGLNLKAKKMPPNSQLSIEVISIGLGNDDVALNIYLPHPRCFKYFPLLYALCFNMRILSGCYQQLALFTSKEKGEITLEMQGHRAALESIGECCDTLEDKAKDVKEEGKAAGVVGVVAGMVERVAGTAVEMVARAAAMMAVLCSSSRSKGTHLLWPLEWLLVVSGFGDPVEKEFVKWFMECRRKVVRPRSRRCLCGKGPFTDLQGSCTKVARTFMPESAMGRSWSAIVATGS